MAKPNFLGPKPSAHSCSVITVTAAVQPFAYDQSSHINRPMRNSGKAQALRHQPTPARKEWESNIGSENTPYINQGKGVTLAENPLLWSTAASTRNRVHELAKPHDSNNHIHWMLMLLMGMSAVGANA
eukprot:1161727-Pelagomonas_calceolata.AAC.11